MFNDYKYLINQAPKDYFLTGTVATLKPITVKLIPTDQSIGAVTTTHLNNINVGSRVLMVRGFNQLIIVAVIGSPNHLTDLITVSLNTTQAITGDNKLLFNNTPITVGSKLTFDDTNKGVKIGKGVKKVEVNSTVWAEAHAGYSWVSIRCSSNLSVLHNSSIFPAYSTQVWRSHHLHAIIPVTENDLIYTYVYINVYNASNNVAGTYTGSTNMTVKVVEYDY